MTIRTANRNQVLLIEYTEHVFREMLGRSDYSMSEIASHVEWSMRHQKIEDYLDKFTLALLRYCLKPVELDGADKPIAQTPEELLKEFKDYLATAPDSEQVDYQSPNTPYNGETTE